MPGFGWDGKTNQCIGNTQKLKSKRGRPQAIKTKYDLLTFNFSYFTPREWLFLAEKGNLKLSDSKMSWREESEKFSLSFNGKLHLKFSGKSY